jgi:uncharacterized protein YcbX
MPAIQAIYRYPIKGLTPEALAGAALRPGQTVPGDRIYAIENGPSGFDPAAPAHLPKQRFLMLMRNERLATLRAAFDQASHTLAVAKPPPTSPALGTDEVRQGASGNLTTPEGRAAIERFFAAFCADELRGPPKVLFAGGHSFSDVARKVVSIINLASVRALEEAAGAAIDPLRFRANLYVEGWPAWHEFDLIGRTLAAGPAARLKVVKRIVRCAATNVDPQTGLRDLALPQTLQQTYGHADCGVYAEVVEGGEVKVGDAIEILAESG